MNEKKNSLMIEGARLIFRNFSGKEGKFNPKGNRNFCVIVPPELLDTLLDEGWNVKYLKPRESEDPEIPYIQVKINYLEGKRPPKIVLITKKGKTSLDEADIDKLDWAEISNVDLIINPYPWSVNGKEGIKAYLKSMYVTLYEDELESKYVDIDDVN